MCYLFKWGYTSQVQKDGSVIKKFSWKYPLAIALVVWVIWYFYLYPPQQQAKVRQDTQPVVYVPNYKTSSINNQNQTGGNAVLPYEINGQKINLMNWN